MKLPAVVVACGALAASSPALAAPCSVGTLASYIALGSDGCTISTATFRDFMALEVPAGSTAIAPEGVTVTPLLDDPLQPGLALMFSAEAPAGEALELLLGYEMEAPSLVRARLDMEGSSVTGDGAVTVLEDLCVGGAFDPTGPTGCDGSVSNLLVFDVGDEALLSEELAFAPVSTLSVVKDIAVDGGLEGSATLASARNLFLVPEPATLLLLGAGVVSLALRRRPRPA